MTHNDDPMFPITHVHKFPTVSGKPPSSRQVRRWCVEGALARYHPQQKRAFLESIVEGSIRYTSIGRFLKFREEQNRLDAEARELNRQAKRAKRP